MPIPVQLYPNIPINVTLRYPNTVISPVPPGQLNVANLFVSNTIVVGNATNNTVINSTSINVLSIVANGTIGSAGQTLFSNGTGLYWDSSTSKLTGNGLTSNSTHFEVLANTGIIANSSGTFVNSAYIATLDSNNATNLGGQPASYYTNATNLSTGTVDFNRLPANIVFWSNTNAYTAIQTYNANINLVANSTAQLNFGNNTVNAAITSNDTHVYFTGTAYEANNANFLDGYDISNIQSDISTAYTNAVTYSSNATNLSSGTINEVLLPYRMNQDVRTTDNVIFNNATISGNLTVIGSSFIVQGNTTTFVDNMLYLNQGVSANITNIITTGTQVRFVANNNYQVGWDVAVTGVNPSSYNGTYLNIIAANSTTFTVSNTNTDGYVSGGIARGKSESNPDLGLAAGYNDGSYHHTGIFRDATDGYWKVFDNYQLEPDASIYIDTSDPSFRIANFWTDTIRLGNTSVYSTANSTEFSGTANNASYLNNQNSSYYTNATNISTGTLDYARLPANAVFWSNTNSYTAVQTYNANLFVNVSTLSIGNTTANITANTTVLSIGNSSVNVSINSTAFSGTANNSTYLGGTISSGYQTTAGLAANVVTLTANDSNNLGGQPASYYTNATNLSTGTLDYARLPANAVFWSNTNSYTAVQTFQANVVLQDRLSANGSFGSAGQVLTSAGSGANVYWATPTGGGGGLLAGNGLISNTTHYEVLANSGIVSNSTGTFVNTAYIATLTANDSTYLGGQNSSYYTNATNISTGTLNHARLPANAVFWSNTNSYTAVQTYNANVFVNAVTLSVGNTTSNVTTNTTTIVVGNSSVNVSINSTAFSGTANNSTYLNGQLASYYTNATNLSTGTLDYARLPANVVIWSNTNTYTAVQTYNANLFVNVSTLSVGNTTSNVTVNTTVLSIGNSSVNTVVNSTALVLKSLIANGSIGGVGELLASNGTGLYWTTPPSGSFSNGTAYTWSAVQTFQANVVLQDRLSANGSFGSAGQVLTSAGTGANVYWATPTGGGGGLSDSYETVNKNLKAYDATYSYSAGILQTITYTIPPSSSIVKTFNYTGGVLTSIVLSGSTPGGIELTKTFGYTSGSLTSVTYT